MMKVLMVCLGNICRSPLAEGILRKKAAEQNLNIEVDSCGTAGYHIGEPADIRSINKAEEHGFDINDLRGRQLENSDLDEFDHILVMDKSNYQNTIALANESNQQKVKLILSYTNSNHIKEVPDPYYGGADGFENVYQLLDNAIDQFIEQEYHG